MNRWMHACVLCAGVSGATAAERDWPTSVELGSGANVGITGNFAYDANRFSRDDAAPDDARGFRRTDFGVFARRKDYFDAGAQFDFESRTWLDIFVRLSSKGLLGRDVGTLRAGWIKTPVSLDGLTASRAPAFLEPALPTQAIYQGRRTGVEWAITRPRYQLSVAHFGGNDPEGVEQGSTVGARAVWTPRKADGDVVHAGVAYSRENPSSERARFRARPEAGLTDTRLVDTRTLAGVTHIERAGLELVRVQGPWTVQAEYLRANARRDALPDVSVSGASVWTGWTLTGESRPYNGTLGNIEPTHATGAVELLARYSTLDLDDPAARGGRQRNWTVGANYYLTEHFKFQLNYVRMHADRAGVVTEPGAVLLRAQMHF